MELLNNALHIIAHSASDDTLLELQKRGITKEILRKTDVVTYKDFPIDLLLEVASWLRERQVEQYEQDLSAWKTLFGLGEPEKFKILWVDDDKTVLEDSIDEAFRLEFGGSVIITGAGSLAEGIDEASKQDYDLVIFDKYLPDTENWDDFLRTIKDVPECIYLTDADKSTTTLLEDLKGIVRAKIMPKPADFEQVARDIQQIIDSRQRHYQEALEQFAAFEKSRPPQQQDAPPEELPKQFRILLVEDEFDARQAFKRVFYGATRGKQRFVLETAPTKQAAIDAMKKEPFDLVFFDIALPCDDTRGTTEKEREEISQEYYALLCAIKNIWIFTGATDEKIKEELKGYIPEGQRRQFYKSSDKEALRELLQEFYEEKVQEHARKMQVWVEKTKPKRPGKFRVLLVDDELTIRDYFTKQFKYCFPENSFEIITAGSRREAVQKMSQETFDIVFFDVALRTVAESTSLSIQEIEETKKAFHSQLLLAKELIIYTVYEPKDDKVKNLGQELL
jgi:CheY-like chemotaxis protein